MRIFYSGYKYDYGDKKRGLSFELLNFYKSLKSYKKTKKIFNYPTDFSRIYSNEKFNKKAEQIINKFKFDIAFFVLFQNEFDEDFFKKIKSKEDIISIAWMSDDHWRFDNYSSKKAHLFDWILTTDKKSLKKYHEMGIKNVILTQWGFNHLDYLPEIKDQSFDVSFIGQPHSNRKKIIRKLKKENISVICRGQGWNDGRVSHQEMVNIFLNSKINLNFTSSSQTINIKSFIKIFLKKSKNFYNFNSLNEIKSNFKNFFKENQKQIKGRFFEITGSGGFLLTEYAPYLDRYFEIEKDIVVFKNYNELVSKIKFYLKNDKMREEIAKNGQLKVLKNHTYHHRFDEIFKKILNFN